MSNSSLVSYTLISPCRNAPRNHKIDTITIHCVVGQLSVEGICGCFRNSAVGASCNYAIGTDGRIGLCVEEKDRSWCSSNAANDHRAITIECASDRTHPYAINDKVYKSLVSLCADICKRNGVKELKWKADRSLIGQVDKQNMTVHRWFANKACPGDYIYNRLGQIAKEVNAQLGGGASVAGRVKIAGPAQATEEQMQAYIKAASGTVAPAELKKGQTVQFIGNLHYTSSYMKAVGKSCKPGKAKVTAINPGSAHPYHLVAVSGGGSTVYGWVDVKAVSV